MSHCPRGNENLDLLHFKYFVVSDAFGFVQLLLVEHLIDCKFAVVVSVVSRHIVLQLVKQSEVVLVSARHVHKDARLQRVKLEPAPVRQRNHQHRNADYDVPQSKKI